jgi:hypothetical protein
MSSVVRFDVVRLKDVNIDEDGYVVLSPRAWRYYARLFAGNGICADQALDTLEDFHDALSRCIGRRATVHKLLRA